MKSLTILLASIFLLQGCSTISKEPSDQEINAEAAKAYEEVKSKSKISDNKEWTEMVNRVAGRIAKASGENFQWEWVLIESKEVNAWCMPGGKIAVYTGIMPVLKTEGALAAVLGHEVAHATRRHGKKQMARATGMNLAAVIAGGAAVLGGQLLCKTQTCKTLTALGGAGAGFAVQFLSMKYSRTDETEADHYGQTYMAQAGYDPAEATKLWDRMAEASGGKAPPELLSTHPSDAHRKQNLQTWLPQAQALYQRVPVKYGVGQNIN